MAVLFDVDRTRITRHINNIYKEQELDSNSTSAENAHMGSLGIQTCKRKIYNFDMIISVGYRVNSKRGIVFRKWATNVLKQYMIKGYAENKKRLIELNKIIQISRRSAEKLETASILSVLDRYSQALDLLDD